MGSAASETVRLFYSQLPNISLSVNPEDLLAKSRDWWPLARLRELRGDQPNLPLAVVYPESTEDVAEIVKWANQAKVAVTPRGLGSGVCGGAVPSPQTIVLDLSRMNRVISIDKLSQVVEVEAGLRGDVLEAALETQDLTLGHYPQSVDISTVGGWIACSSSGQASPGYGSIEDHVLGLTAVLGTGEIVELKPQPRSTVGPDFKRLLVGSEGTLGVVTRAHLSCAPLDPEMTWRAYNFDGFERTFDFAREIRRSGIAPRVLRGWDELDSLRAFGPQGHSGGCVGLVGIPTSMPGLVDRCELSDGIAGHCNGRLGSPAYGSAWWARRLDAVKIFDDVMGPARSLGTGSLIDTFEVTALWRDLPTVYQDVRRAIATSCPNVRCHFSHVYGSGAALYFTFVLNEVDDFEVEKIYLTTWEKALAACIGAKGAIAHHHGLGRLKKGALEASLGKSASRAIGEVRQALDPSRTLNPDLLV